MMAGYEVGFFAAAGAQALLLPHYGWRSLFFVGVAPALLAIFIRVGIDESPVWLRDQRRQAEAAPTTKAKPKPEFRMTPAAWQACAFMAMLQFQTASIYAFYPTLLKTDRGFDPNAVFAAVAVYSVGSILGKIVIGQVASRLGTRTTIIGCLCLTMLGIVPFATASAMPLVLLTAGCVGASSSGVFALVPHYLSLRFGNAVRSFGMGLAYAVAAFGQAVATYAVPATAHETGLSHAIVLFVGATSIAAAIIAFREPRDLPGRDMREAAPSPA